MENKYVEWRDSGYWVAGTRVSLDSIVFSFLEGLSPETIAVDCFPVLTLEQIYGAIAYYLAHRSEIDTYLKQSESEFVAWRQEIQSANRDFYEKLTQSRRMVGAGFAWALLVKINNF